MSHLRIDWTRCDGHGLCALAYPDAIGLDEWGYPLLPTHVDAADMTQARRAIAACPALALRLEDTVRKQPA